MKTRDQDSISRKQNHKCWLEVIESNWLQADVHQALSRDGNGVDENQRTPFFCLSKKWIHHLLFLVVRNFPASFLVTIHLSQTYTNPTNTLASFFRPLGHIQDMDLITFTSVKSPWLVAALMLAAFLLPKLWEYANRSQIRLCSRRLKLERASFTFHFSYS